MKEIITFVQKFNLILMEIKLDLPILIFNKLEIKMVTILSMRLKLFKYCKIYIMDIEMKYYMIQKKIGINNQIKKKKNQKKKLEQK